MKTCCFYIQSQWQLWYRHTNQSTCHLVYGQTSTQSCDFTLFNQYSNTDQHHHLLSLILTSEKSWLWHNTFAFLCAGSKQPALTIVLMAVSIFHGNGQTMAYSAQILEKFWPENHLLYFLACYQNDPIKVLSQRWDSLLLFRHVSLVFEG